MLLLVIRTNDTIYNKLQESILMGINKNKRILRHLRLQSFQKSYYPTDDHVRPFFGPSWKQVFRSPVTKSLAKEYLKVYTDQFLFWKKCDLNHYPWFRQAIYKIDEIYMDIHKIVDNDDVSWLLDGLSKQNHSHEIVDAVNKVLDDRLNQSILETRRIFDEAISKDHDLQDYRENLSNRSRVLRLEEIVKENGVEIPDSPSEFTQITVSEPEDMRDLIKAGRYVRPSFFVQLITEECHIKTHEKYSTNHEKKHNEWASNRLKPEITEKRRNIYRNDEKIKNLKGDLSEAKYIIHNITSGALENRWSEERKEDLLSFSMDKEVRLTAEIQHLQEANNSLQEEINELRSKLF